MNKIKISIIVPVYNCQFYLAKCLDSLICQTLEKIEIICINDGSTDASLSIIEKYSAKDNRIKIINQENQGQSKARNKGLRVAQGEYIGFVDSDDWIEENFFEKLVDAADKNNADIACGNVCYYNELKNIMEPDNFLSRKTFRSSVDLVDNLEQKYDLLSLGIIWNKVYKREIIIDNNVQFPEGVKFEDNAFTFICMVLSDKIAMVKDTCYFYNIRDNSTMTSIKQNDEKIWDFFAVFEFIWEYLENLDISIKDKNIYKQLLQKFQINLLYSWVKQVNGDFKQRFLDKTKESFTKFEINDSRFFDKKTRRRYNRIMNDDRMFNLGDYFNNLCNRCSKQQTLLRK